MLRSIIRNAISKVKQKKQVQSLEQENDCKQNHMQISQIYKQKQIGKKKQLFCQSVKPQL